ncbi:putative ankyrin repeat protein RF_0381 [Oppia nitens]|uniref:putative ankyrin repeat protein RF_0381 n=1 Tax=Oppia nitens TaxID=1686743 RepID=UPI0023DACE3D|nr:putative ankyrin repeat protein RF_0381 [Oppia nitens]
MLYIRVSKTLTELGVDSDVRFYSGTHHMPALCLCAQRGHLDLVKLLLKYGCSTNQVDTNGRSALHFACNHLFVEIVKLLIANRATLNMASNYGHIPLHLAAQQPSLELVRLLVESGSDLEKKDLDGRTPLVLAILNNQFEIVEFLVLQGSDVNTVDNCGNTPLLHAINSGLSINPEIVKILLQAGANPNISNNYGLNPLITTIRRSSDHTLDGQDTVRHLIDHNCDLNIYEYDSAICGESALHLAISRNQDRITEMLIRAGADVNVPNQMGLTPISRLVKEGKIDLIKLMIASGADTNLNRNLSLNEAVLRNHLINNDNEVNKLIVDQSHCFLRLKHLCRVRLRSWLERRADYVIKQTPIPSTIRRYLLLNDL